MSKAKTVSFDGGIYSLGNDVANGQVSDIKLLGNTIMQYANNDGFGGSNLVLHRTNQRTAPILNIANLKGDTQYTICVNLLNAQNMDFNLGLQIINNTTSENSEFTLGKLNGIYKRTFTPVNSGVFRLYFFIKTANNADATITVSKDIMILEGDWTTKEIHYLSYGTKSTNSVRIRSVNEDETKESIVNVNLPEPLRSLPNGVKDEVNVGLGQKIQRIKKYILQASDVSFYTTSGANVDIVGIKRPTDHIAYGKSRSPVGDTVLGNYTQVNTPDHDNTSYINCFTLRNTEDILLFVAKGTYANLAAAQAALAGTTLTYQLASPIFTDIPKQKLEVFENGTVYVDPIGDPSETTLPTVELTVPIAGSGILNILPKPPSIEKPSSITWEEYIQEMYDIISDLDNLAGEGRTDETVKGNADTIADLAGEGRTDETVKGNADAIADLAGEGRTDETVKGNADAIADLAGEGRTTETVKKAYDLASKDFPTCLLRLSANYSVPNDTGHVIDFSTATVIVDNDDMYDSAVSTTKLIIKTAGIYLIELNAKFAANGVGVRNISIRKNDTSYVSNDSFTPPDGVSMYPRKINCILNLDVNDWIEMRVFQSSGDTLNIVPEANISGEIKVVYLSAGV